MACKSDNRLAHVLLQVFSLLAFFPFKYVPRTHRMEFPRSKLRYLMFRVSFCACCVFALCTLTSFLNILVFIRPNLEYMNGVVVQWTFAVGFLACMLWHIQLFLQCPQIAVALSNNWCNHLKGKISVAFIDIMEAMKSLKFQPLHHLLTPIFSSFCHDFLSNGPTLMEIGLKSMRGQSPWMKSKFYVKGRSCPFRW